jgi:hypothetical protein
MNMDHDSLPGDQPETGHVSTGVLPPDTDVQGLILAGYERYRDLDEGAVADYIPALAAASPTAFGVCVAGVGPVEVTGSAGDFIMTHCLLPHCASNNRNERARVAYFVRYARLDHPFIRRHLPPRAGTTSSS